MGSIGRSAYLARAYAGTHVLTRIHVHMYAHTDVYIGCFEIVRPNLSKVILRIGIDKKIRRVGTEMQFFRSTNDWYVILQFVEYTKLNI